MDFELTLDWNPYLAEGSSRIHAVASIAPRGPTTRFSVVRTDLSVTEIIIIDASGSMAGERLHSAKRAVSAALGSLRPGTSFAIIAGKDYTQQLFPPGGGLAVIDGDSRHQAEAALKKLRADGGTDIASWLRAATELARGVNTDVRHATLLSDGKDAGSAKHLARAIESARNVMQVDCRGIGVDWSPTQLRSISDALLGTLDIVADPQDLDRAFAELYGQLMGLRFRDVQLRVWTPRGVQVEALQQVSPEIVTLPSADDVSNPHVNDYRTGAWGEESRVYQLTYAIPPGRPGDELLVSRLTLMLDGAATDAHLLHVTWTDDVELSTRVHPAVAHFSGQAEMSSAIQRGLSSRRAGDTRDAERLLGEAVALATEAGNEDTLTLLRRLVTIEDAATGRVRLLEGASTTDEMTLETRSTRTAAVRRLPATSDEPPSV